MESPSPVRTPERPWPHLPNQEPADLGLRYRDARTLANVQEDEDWRRLKWLDVIEGLAGAPEKTVLDYGCGLGDFLAVAKEHGWDAVGIEQSPIARTAAKTEGHEVWSEEIGNSPKGWGAIVCSYVLEHLPSPEKTLAMFHSWLQPGGIAYFCVPNDFNPFQRSCERQEDWWVSPRHLHYWNFESFEALLEQTGFVPLARTTSFPMSMFRLLGLGYHSGREQHEMRVKLDQRLSMHARRTFYSALAGAGLGRSVEVFALKPLEA